MTKIRVVKVEPPESEEYKNAWVTAEDLSNGEGFRFSTVAEHKVNDVVEILRERALGRDGRQYWREVVL